MADSRCKTEGGHEFAKNLNGGLSSCVHGRVHSVGHTT